MPSRKNRFQYLSYRDILTIHARVVDASGGTHGVRDIGLLKSVVERPKATFAGKSLYSGLYMKAAAYLESLARHHVFIDGNKRTALTVAARFLFLNGYELTASNEEAERFVLEAAVGRHEIKDIAQWFKKHAKKQKNR